MDGWRRRTSNQLRKHGYEPLSMNRINRGDENTVIKVELDSRDIVIKWFTSDVSPVIPQPGKPIDRFIGGWYVQNRLDEIVNIPIPSITTSEFSKDDTNYYVMDMIPDFQDSNVWFKDTYTLTVCREIGSILSRLHSVSKASIGGIPGKTSDSMMNMRRVVKQTEKNIKNTPLESYRSRLDKLSQQYESQYQDKKESIVHGDLVASNIMTDSDGVITGITDWDDSMFSDPLYDIAVFESMVCDIMGTFSPWDREDLRGTVEEAYSNAVNTKRLNIIRAIVHLNAMAKIHNGFVLTSWSEVSQTAEKSRKKIHRDMFEDITEKL